MTDKDKAVEQSSTAGAAKGGITNDNVSPDLAQAGVRTKPVKLPSTPEEMIAFIGSHFNFMHGADNPENVRYDLTVHDLLSAFRWWFEDATPTTPAQVPAAEVRTAVARAIWNIRREDEDRCDMELEDMGEDHSVWAEADAAIRSLAQSSTADKATEVRAAGGNQ